MALSFSFFSVFFRAIILVIFLCFSVNSHAVVLNFDELNSEDFIIDGEIRTLGSYYSDLGVVFSDHSFVLKWGFYGEIASTEPNYIGGAGTSISFIGELPTFVSLVIFGVGGMATFLEATGPGGYTQLIQSSGEVRSIMDPNLGTPYIHNQLISFSSATGISRISLSGQAGANFDDLTFIRPSEVNEPPILLLFASYFFILVLAKLKRYFFS